MELQKIILYYGFTPISDPEAIQLWQQTLCESLGLKGRILISKHGINGTVGGKLSALRKFARLTKHYPGFRNIDFKYSDGSADHFPKLRVRIRPELVAFGANEELEIGPAGVIGGGKHLEPRQVHQLVSERGDDVVFFDGRNAFESKIGKFKNAIVPDVETTHDFVKEIESGKYDHLKDKPVVTYCTGGIRCEVLTVAMRNRGFQEVYQIKGGVVRYGQKYGDKGLWEGSLYVFDDRMKMDFKGVPKLLGDCDACENKTNDFFDCSALGCRDLVLLCTACAQIPSALACRPEHTRGKRIGATVG